MSNSDDGGAMTTGSPPDPSGPTTVRDVDALIARWEAMSEHYLVGRAELVGAAVEQLSLRIAADSVTVVELGSGPGTLLARLATTVPSASLVGVEIDPVLRRIHQLGAPGRAPDRVQVVDTDLSEPRWVHALPVAPGTVDVVIAVQVLHYFPAARFGALLAEIRELLVDGGVLVHLDRVPRPESPGSSTGHVPEASAVDPWSTWWGEVSAVPCLAEATRERRRQLEARPLGSAEYHPDEASLRALFNAAGLRTVLFERRIGDSLLTIVSSDGRRSPIG